MYCDFCKTHIPSSFPLPRHKNSLFCFLGVSTFKSNDCIVLLLIIFNLLFQDSIIHSICSTHDIDFFCHMNNAKYFKELDFARFDFYFRSGLSDYVEARKEIYVVQHAAMIRYRRPLNFLMPFIVKTKMVYYDERSLYFEQTFISKPDNFIRAVALCKNTIGVII